MFVKWVELRTDVGEAVQWRVEVMNLIKVVTYRCKN